MPRALFAALLAGMLLPGAPSRGGADDPTTTGAGGEDRPAAADLRPISSDAGHCRLELATLAGGGAVSDPQGGSVAGAFTFGVRFNILLALYLRPTILGIWGEGQGRGRLLTPLLFEVRIRRGLHIALGPSMDLAFDPQVLLRPGIAGRVGVCVYSMGPLGCFRADNQPTSNVDISVDLESRTTFYETQPLHAELILLLGTSVRWLY